MRLLLAKIPERWHSLPTGRHYPYMGRMIGYDVLVSRISINSMTPVNTKSYNGIDPHSMTVTSNGDVVIVGQKTTSTFNGQVLSLSYALTGCCASTTTLTLSGYGHL
ncbi:MAG: hypothetical protein R3C61_01305 [Bacteroidia bacterium]